MSAELLDRAIDELVERCDDAYGDWDDVLRRAKVAPTAQLTAVIAPARRRSSLRKRRLTIALAIVLVIVAVLMATPAFGLREAILGLFGRSNVTFDSSKSAPTLVRRQFSDLSLGAPPGLAAQAIASKSRTVATFAVDRKRHTLWVAPTKSGGFCWEISEAAGGCINRAGYKRGVDHGPAILGAVHPELLGVSYLMAPSTNGPGTIPADIGVVVLSPKATRLVAHFPGGRTFDLPFVFVSKPINAGFAYWQIPAAHQKTGSGLLSVSAYDARGQLVARYPTPSFIGGKAVPQPSNIKPSPPPSPLGTNIPAPTDPLRHGRGDGVSITIGANAVVVFDTGGLDSARRAVMKGGLNVGCFKIDHDAAGVWPRELGDMRGFGPMIKVQMFGVPKPYDGCEIEATYGHTWPDKFNSHSAVEIPLTAVGRTFFADRAAARNLALFVRSHRQLRRENTVELHSELAKFGSRLVQLSSAAAVPPTGKIGYSLTGGELIFVERSTTGKLFRVVVKGGRITTQNLKPYAFVF